MKEIRHFYPIEHIRNLNTKLHLLQNGKNGDMTWLQSHGEISWSSLLVVSYTRCEWIENRKWKWHICGNIILGMTAKHDKLRKWIYICQLRINLAPINLCRFLLCICLLSIILNIHICFSIMFNKSKKQEKSTNIYRINNCVFTFVSEI